MLEIVFSASIGFVLGYIVCTNLKNKDKKIPFKKGIK